MTIQPSILIWTVICFIALYFILKFLLFKPILKLMDERKQKIENAEKENLEAKKRIEEEKRILLEAKEQKKKQLIAEQEKKNEILRSEVKKQLEDAKAERFADMEEFRKKINDEFVEDMKSAEDATSRAAELFLSHLFD